MSGRDPAERRAAVRTYLIGYGSALVLTVAAFAAVYRPVAAANTTFAIVLALALVQAVVQLRCFLHIGFTRSGRSDAFLTIFAAVIIALMVSGTLVILFNLQTRMM